MSKVWSAIDSSKADTRQSGLQMEACTQCRHRDPKSSNTLGSCNAACGRYRRRHAKGSLGKGAGHPSAELSPGSRGVMNRGTLYAIALGI